MTPIYLDHNGTTPVEPEVLAAMLPFFREQYGNPSSATPLGRRAKDAIETARSQVAALIGARPAEVVFMSGGTEASNQAIFGLAESAAPQRRRIVTTTVEHPATEMPCRRLAERGFEVVRVPVHGTGVLDIDRAREAIDNRTALATVIHAQNETGVLQPVAELSAQAVRAGVPLHIDASQSIGKVPIDVDALGISALTIAGHKLYAPKGIGALYLRQSRDAPSVLAGAGQENGRRPGTENVAYIVGLGRAAEIARARLADDAARMSQLRESLWGHLSAAVPGIIRVGDGAPTLPNTLNVLFPGAAGHDVLARSPQIAASTGSACHAGETRPSAIILAHGYAPALAAGAVRLSIGRQTTVQEIEIAATQLAAAWKILAR